MKLYAFDKNANPNSYYEQVTRSAEYTLAGCLDALKDTLKEIYKS